MGSVGQRPFSSLEKSPWSPMECQAHRVKLTSGDTLSPVYSSLGVCAGFSPPRSQPHPQHRGQSLNWLPESEWGAAPGGDVSSSAACHSLAHGGSEARPPGLPSTMWYPLPGSRSSWDPQGEPAEVQGKTKVQTPGPAFLLLSLLPSRPPSLYLSCLSSFFIELRNFQIWC